jgi:cytochrome c peroxidase
MTFDPGFMPEVRRRVALEGRGPRAVAVVGSRAYVAGYFSDALEVVDLARGEVVRTIALGPTPRLSRKRRGEMLFHDATLCYQHWQSCSTCHPDARADGLNWDLLNDGVANPKNAKSLLLAHATPPAMSLGVRATAEEAVRSGIEHILFGEVRETDAEAIDAYLQSLRPVPSPHLVGGRLSPAARRGERLFERAGCSDCHPAPLYTDQLRHDVASRGPYDFHDRFDTPTLVEVWRTAPYLHDGRYRTMREVLVEGKHGNRNGALERLSEEEMDDLVEFVLSL